MNEMVRDLEQALEAVLDRARSLFVTTREDEAEIDRLLGVVEHAESQLAAVRLRLVAQGQFGLTGKVVDRVRHSVRTTGPQATGMLRLASELNHRFGLLTEALEEGRISEAQADAIVFGLRRVPEPLGRHDLERCQRQLLAFCATLGPAELRVAATRVWELLDPEGAELIEARRLKREERKAKIGRSLRLSPDHHGSMRISGQLPLADAALLQAQLDALQPPASSYIEEGEGFVPPVDARRADALVRLSQVVAAAGEVPKQGWDRPHLQVTMPLSLLTDGLGRAELFGIEGEQLSAREARRLACDARIIPMVLGSDSQPLDVGRESRLVTRPIRAALVQRDRGCAFPHCTARPAACEAHHIQPWWAGGKTSVDNLVLLCPYHHRLVEPDPGQSEKSQWKVQIDESSGMPQFRPPVHIDPAQRLRQHRRHALAGMAPPPEQECRVAVPKIRELDPLDDPWHPDYVPPHRRLSAPVP